MADYEFQGLRQALIKNPSAELYRLEGRAAHEAPLSHNLLMKELERYFNRDIVAIYLSGGKNYKPPNDFTNALFIRGELEGVNADELLFNGETVRLPQGIKYKGTSWIVNVSQLVDMVAVADYRYNANPFEKSYHCKEFEFGTMSGNPIGSIEAITPLGAYLGLIERMDTFQREMTRGATTPIRLISIKDVPDVSLEKTMQGRSGTGTGY